MLCFCMLCGVPVACFVRVWRCALAFHGLDPLLPQLRLDERERAHAGTCGCASAMGAGVMRARSMVVRVMSRLRGFLSLFVVGSEVG